MNNHGILNRSKMRKTLQSQPPHAVVNLRNLALCNTNDIVKIIKPFKEGKADTVENIITFLKDVGVCHGRRRYIVKDDSTMAKLVYLARHGGIDSCELFENLGEFFTFFLNWFLFLNLSSYF